MKEIILTRGRIALVDDDDYDRLKFFRWCVKIDKGAKVEYAVSRCGGGEVKRMHRLILRPKATDEIDHINGNGLDNRKENLRVVTPSENRRNSGKWSYRNKEEGRKCTSRFKGVCKSTNPRANPKGRPWMSYITHEYKRLYLGWFATEIEAAKTYNQKAIELFGEHARLNVIKE